MRCFVPSDTGTRVSNRQISSGSIEMQFHNTKIWEESAESDTLYKRAVKPRASNIRINLATVLKAEGRTEEAKKIMDALSAEGMLIDSQMAILGDFRAPGLQR
jgi:hypothetical protein